jgi:hypothetical protein
LVPKAPTEVLGPVFWRFSSTGFGLQVLELFEYSN